MTEKKFSNSYHNDYIIEALAYYQLYKSYSLVETKTGIPASTVRGWNNRDDILLALGQKISKYHTNLYKHKKVYDPKPLELDNEKIHDIGVTDGTDPEDWGSVSVPEKTDKELIEANVKLANKVQRLNDQNRIERASFRSHARAYNMLEELTSQLIEVFKDRKFNLETVKHQVYDLHGGPAPIGVIQLSDLHINQVIQDMVHNVFNIDIASKRIYKHVCQSINKFKTEGVQKVVIALTGDLLKSSRRMSEATENSMSGANGTFIMVDILCQIVKHINQEGFNVVIASVIGNESRTAEFIETTDYLASDNFDAMVHRMLQYILKGQEGVTVLPMTNPFECVLELNGQNILMIHGHGHGRSANTPDKSFDAISSRYSANGVRIDHIIMGHIHSAQLGDRATRSSGLPGNDQYAVRTLNLWGKPSQVALIVYADGTIDGIKHDLQKTDGWAGYQYDKLAEELMINIRYQNGKGQGNTTISMNGIPFASYVI